MERLSYGMYVPNVLLESYMDMEQINEFVNIMIHINNNNNNDSYIYFIDSLAWNDHVLVSGAEDAFIIHHDVRIRESEIRRDTAHQSQICSLAWNPEGDLLASGSNDNVACVWD